MNSLVIEHPKAADLPRQWAEQLNANSEATFTVRIEAEEAPKTTNSAFGLWQDAMISARSTTISVACDNRGADADRFRCADLVSARPVEGRAVFGCLAGAATLGRELHGTRPRDAQQARTGRAKSRSQCTTRCHLTHYRRDISSRRHPCRESLSQPCLAARRCAHRSDCTRMRITAHYRQR